MSIQKEFDGRNPPCERLTVVESKHNSAMQCANPQCSKELLYLREGTLELLELESPSDNQFRPDEGAFATRPLPSKFFWLCGECAKTHIVRRWTTFSWPKGRLTRKTFSNHKLSCPPRSIAS